MGVFVDASVFLGMHSKVNRVRRASKNVFVRNHTIWMPREDVGAVDDFIWSNFSDRRMQDLYFAFMDELQTVRDIRRVSSREYDLPAGVPAALGIARAEGGLLFSYDIPEGRRPRGGKESRFPRVLEGLYRDSLAIRT